MNEIESDAGYLAATEEADRLVDIGFEELSDEDAFRLEELIRVIELWEQEHPEILE